MRASMLLWLVPTVLASQQPRRKIEGELSGNLFFGNTQQVLASTRAEFERADTGSAFRANYDNQAVLRGARVNNDGELLVGLLTTF